MWRILGSLVFIVVAGSLRGQQRAPWLTDFETAKQTAKRENKYLLLNFTGSDWCPACRQLKAEVFDTPEFNEFAQAHLVLMEIDFPRHKALTELQARANRQLAALFRVDEFPTLILIDPEIRTMRPVVYGSGGPRAFDNAIAGVLQPDAPAPASIAKPEQPHKPLVFTPPPPATPIHYGELALKGISGPKDHRVVLINDQTLSVGETAAVRVENRKVVVSCKSIGEKSVTITADGKLMELSLREKADMPSGSSR